MGNLNVIMRKHWTNLNWEVFYEIIGPYSSKKNVKIKEDTERVRNGSRLNETKKPWHLNEMHDPGSDPGLRKKIAIKEFLGNVM